MGCVNCYLLHNKYTWWRVLGHSSCQIPMVLLCSLAQLCFLVSSVPRVGFSLCWKQWRWDLDSGRVTMYAVVWSQESFYVWWDWRSSSLEAESGAYTLSLTPGLLAKPILSPVSKKFFQRSNSSSPKGPLGLGVLGQDARQESALSAMSTVWKA